MEYSIRQLSELAGVSARTLRYYDSMGLLKPLYVNEAGYRFYGQEQVDLLQQILFYRERAFSLKQIQEIIYRRDFDVLSALEEHLQELKYQQNRTKRLIEAVSNTIASMKGEYVMNDKEKFEAFKKKVVEENEKLYGKEIREKYSDVQVEESNRKLLNMTEEDYQRFKQLEQEILIKLKKAVEAKLPPESEAAKEIVLLHKEWLSMTWKQYTPEAHKGVALMYTADERFTRYYDIEVTGCAAFLEQAINHWAK